jgi:cysteine-rich repeat protein
MPERRDDFPGAGDHDSTFMMRGLWGHAAVTAALLVVSCTFEVVELPAQTARRACGNFILDPGEVCDDGNTVGGDGCSADCKSLEVCGNAIVDPGELCDDGAGGNADDADCTASCQVNVCGDGRPDVRGVHLEQCDAGNGSPRDQRHAWQPVLRDLPHRRVRQRRDRAGRAVRRWRRQRPGAALQRGL